ncbi:hypothetical protein KFL_000610250 [Klebsormidium nitens]|uniref:Protein BCCIP homolog n=1 Tax=Klebsormidium nitens TaxID=105231 RepID=A0A0U9HQM6_KLENI|nr:hypothetical protein KFL_000610250 [Klebsormidium nitens]|eukprot:GAQ80747.1 hypothetical protein KFL_000610250 [Klebsormidium nitens]
MPKRKATDDVGEGAANKRAETELDPDEEAEIEEEEIEEEEVLSSDDSSGSSGYGSGGGEEDEESGEEDKEEPDFINVDFEFFDPKPSDYHGVKALLKSYLDDETFDLPGLVDLVLAQTTVGSVIKTTEDEDPIGLLTVLAFERYKDTEPTKQIVRFLRLRCKKDEHTAGKLEVLLDGKKGRVGLLVSERLINVPLDLAPPLHQGLFDEISWATEDEPTEELRESFRFSKYLLLTRVFEETQRADRQAAGPSSRGGDPSSSTIYMKPEDEIWEQLSSWAYRFPVTAEALAAHESKHVRQMYLLMEIDPSKLPAFKKRLQKLVEDQN